MLETALTKPPSKLPAKPAKRGREAPAASAAKPKGKAADRGASRGRLGGGGGVSWDDVFGRWELSLGARVGPRGKRIMSASGDC